MLIRKVIGKRSGATAILVLLAILAAVIARGQAVAGPGLQPGSQGATVEISLNPATAQVSDDETFTMDIMVDTGVQEVSAVQAYLDFDPTKLQVEDSNPVLPGVQIQGGSALPIQLPSSTDNALGQINYAAGKLEAPFPSGTFVLATITFRAIDPTPTTNIAFSTQIPRNTFADFLGTPLNTNVSGATVEVTGPLMTCTLPGVGDWSVTLNCSVQGDIQAPASVIVENNVTLVITEDSFLDIDFSTYNLRIKSGAKVIIQNGGKIH